MIDKRRIEEAKEEIYEDSFLLNGEEIVFDNDAKEEMFYKEDIKEAIGLGAKWAINEFLKSLWHPTSEEPNNIDDKLLIEFEDCHKLTTRISLYRTVDWQYFIEKAKITRWLYIDNLLPDE